LLALPAVLLWLSHWHYLVYSIANTEIPVDLLISSKAGFLFEVTLVSLRRAWNWKVRLFSCPSLLQQCKERQGSLCWLAGLHWNVKKMGRSLVVRRLRA